MTTATTQNLSVGSTGDAVKAVQTQLGITADGIYGPQTAAAVKAYQQANNLTVDGIVGPQTLGKLSTPAPTRAPAAPTQPVQTPAPAPQQSGTQGSVVSPYVITDAQKAADTAAAAGDVKTMTGQGGNVVSTTTENGADGITRTKGFDANGTLVYTIVHSQSQDTVNNSHPTDNNAVVGTDANGNPVTAGNSQSTVTAPVPANPQPASTLQPVAPVVAAPASGAATVDTSTAAAPAGATATAQLSLTRNLSSGVQGSDVAALQQKLGIKADGIFGNQTAAAVKAFQQAHGLVADGIVGQKTLAALNGGGTGAAVAGADTGTPSGTSSPTDQLTNQVNDILKQFGITPPSSTTQSPQTSFADTYAQVYQSMGLTDIKSQFDNFNQQLTDLNSKKTDEITATNNNPWLSEGIRQKQLAQIDEKYKLQEDTLTNEMKLTQTMFESGQKDAQFLAGKIFDQYQADQKLNADEVTKAIDIAESQITAQQKLEQATTPEITNYNQAKKEGFKGTFLDYQKEAANLKASASGSNPYTDYNAKEAATQKVAQSKLGAYLAQKTGPDGYAAPESYRAAKAAWVQDGYSGADFDKIFGGLVNPTDPQNYSAALQAKPFPAS